MSKGGIDCFVVRAASRGVDLVKYFGKEDAPDLVNKCEPGAASVALPPNIAAERNSDGELIGIEILNAGAVVRDLISNADLVRRFPGTTFPLPGTIAQNVQE